MSLEKELLAWLKENLPPSGRLPVGLGDDAAVLGGFERAGVVVTSDMLTDGVDFLLAEVEPRRVGRKALGVNLSDLAAMAAEPVAGFVSLVLPRQGSGRRSGARVGDRVVSGDDAVGRAVSSRDCWGRYEYLGRTAGDQRNSGGQNDLAGL